MEGMVFLSILLNELISFLFMEGKHPHTSMKPKSMKIPTNPKQGFLSEEYAEGTLNIEQLCTFLNVTMFHLLE